jgi:UDP-N-acetyl-2-amino-2-deoxyglucuronate dehydrogenase
MTGKTAGIGIVGCGVIADIHAGAIKDMKGGRLIAVYSRNLQKAAAFGEKHHAAAYSEWEKFINHPDLDLAVICTPNGTHLDYGKRVAAAGKHVIVEKPVEISTSRGQELIEFCRSRRVALAVIYQNRFLPDVIRLVRIIQEQKLGRIFMASAYIKWFRTQEYYDADAWRGTGSMEGGGVLINQAIHTVDLLQWITGGIKTVMGAVRTATHSNIEVEDNAVAALEFRNHAVGVLEASTSAIPAVPRRIEIHGTLGSAILNGDHLQVMKEGDVYVPGEKQAATGAAGPLAGFSTEPHRQQLESIVEAIAEGRQPPVSGADSLESLKVVEAVYRSSKIKQAVEL